MTKQLNMKRIKEILLLLAIASFVALPLTACEGDGEGDTPTKPDPKPVVDDPKPVVEPNQVVDDPKPVVEPNQVVEPKPKVLTIQEQNKTAKSKRNTVRYSTPVGLKALLENAVKNKQHTAMYVKNQKGGRYANKFGVGNSLKVEGSNSKGQKQALSIKDWLRSDKDSELTKSLLKIFGSKEFFMSYGGKHITKDNGGHAKLWIEICLNTPTGKRPEDNAKVRLFSIDHVSHIIKDHGEMTRKRSEATYKKAYKPAN